MSIENFEYRTNPMFLRNQFKITGKYGIPMIPKFDFFEDELEDLKLIGYNVAKSGKDSNI